MNAPTPNDAWRRPPPPSNGDPAAVDGADPPLLYFGDTDVGRRRSINQDNFVVGDVQLPTGQAVLLAVADGMGGAAGGEVASSHAVEQLRRVLQEVQPGRSEGDLLAEGIIAANRAIFEHGQADPSLQGMGTTMVLVLVRGRQAVVGHVGDSRALLIRSGLVHRLTVDHSWVAEQVRRGEITEEEAEQSNFRNVLTRSVGVAGSVTPEVSPPFELFPGDVILLCSDGLHGYVPEPVIAQVATSEDPQSAVAHLINLANEAGGPDNITVVIGRVPGAPPASVLPPPTPASTVAQTERIPASAIPPVPPPASPGPPPPGMAAPSGLPVPPGAYGAAATPPPASAGAQPEKGRNRLLFIGGALAAALAIVGGGLFAASRGGKSTNPRDGGQASATILPSATIPASLPALSPTAGGGAVGSPATTATSPARTATPAATQDSQPNQTAPPGSAGRPPFISQPIASLSECPRGVEMTDQNVFAGRTFSPCRFTVPADDNRDWSAGHIEAEFEVSPDCLRRANQQWFPQDPPPVQALPGAVSQNDLNIIEGFPYRLVMQQQCMLIPSSNPALGTATPTSTATLATPTPPPSTRTVLPTPPFGIPTVRN